MELVYVALSWRDYAALALFLAVVNGLSYLIERPCFDRPSLAWMMARRRERWMQLMADRDVRIMDTALLAIQHQGAAFFASACLIAIGGVAAVIGNTDVLLSVADDLAAESLSRDPALWEIKLLFLLGLLATAFLKFAWSHRLFGYCSILIGATPPDTAPPAKRDRVSAQAAVMNIRAGRSFNRGLRLIYFGFAALAWLLGPLFFALATVAIGGMLYRREFLSETRRALQAAGEM